MICRVVTDFRSLSGISTLHRGRGGRESFPDASRLKADVNFRQFVCFANSRITDCRHWNLSSQNRDSFVTCMQSWVWFDGASCHGQLAEELFGCCWPLRKSKPFFGRQFVCGLIHSITRVIAALVGTLQELSSPRSSQIFNPLMSFQPKARQPVDI